MKSKIMKIHKQTKDGTATITIPKPYMEFLEWQPGDKITIQLEIQKESIIMKKEIENEISNKSE